VGPGQATRVHPSQPQAMAMAMAMAMGHARSYVAARHLGDSQGSSVVHGCGRRLLQLCRCCENGCLMSIALGHPRWLLGRDAEIALLASLLDGVQGGGGTLVLYGEPGIGKSGLLAVSAAFARERGFRC
jgi:hypothetical protein